MHKTLFLLFLLPFCLQAADAPTPVETKIEKVVVFRSGAQIIRKGKTSLVAGKSQLIFKGISPKINPQSIQVKGEGDFTVLSVVHQLNTLEEQTKRVEIDALEQEQKKLVEDIQREKALLQVYKQEEAMLLKNQDIKGEQTGLKTSELREALDFHRQRQIEIQTKHLDLERTIKDLGEQLGKINKQLLNLNQSKDLSTGEVLVTVNSKTALNAAFTLTYFVQNAAWYPTYDIRVKDIDKPLVIDYKANVAQASGEDWTEVKLTLSSADPNQGGQKPTIPVWYLQNYTAPSSYNFQPVSTTTATTTGTKLVSGRVLDAEGQPMIAATVISPDGEVGTYTNENGYYSLQVPQNVGQLQVQYVGYESANIPANQANGDMRLRAASQTLNEVAVLGQKADEAEFALSFRGATEGGTQYVIDGVKVRGYPTSGIVTGEMNNRSYTYGLADKIAEEKNKEVYSLVNEHAHPTSLTFEIELPYTVPKDGKIYTVEIKENEINARYEYYCAPRFDKDAFLTAQIVGWEEYNLLSGETNLFFEGTYLGKGYLDLEKAGDTLGISLGRDKNVVINRTKAKDFSKNQVLGNNRTEFRAWDITIRHTKKAPIYLILEDQYPLSTEKEVEVSRLEHKEAILNEETGKLTWKLNVEPNKEKKIGFKYSVKSGKYRNFVLD